MSSTSDNQDTDQPAARRPRGGISRRAFLWVGAGAAAAGLFTWRLGFYPTASWDGEVLAEWEAHVVAAAAEAIIPDEPGVLPPYGPAPMELARNVDRFLVSMPSDTITEIHGMFGLIEHGTLLGGSAARFTRLDAHRRRVFLAALRDRGEMIGQAARGIRDLVMVGWYQHPGTWRQMGYGGPMVAVDQLDPAWRVKGRYSDLVAEPGARPRGAL